MVRRSTISEYQPAPPCYRNVGLESQTPGGPTNIISVVNQPTQMQAPSAFRQTDGNGNRINSAGVALAINANLQQKSIDNPIFPSS